MQSSRSHDPKLLILLTTLVALMVASGATAYDRYSQNDDATNCGACHGDFRASSYVSLSDGQTWSSSLHNVHRSDMLSADCDVCHSSSGLFPVYLSSSVGGAGLDPAGCTGCHGRNEDNVPANPDYPNGMSAGLRQHHTAAGVDDCLRCHDDADPANYTPVAETVLPAYYANPGTGNPAIPTTACNGDGSENFEGSAIGLDNDGDLAYDGDDADCSSSAVGFTGPALARLLPNHPNPLNPMTTIVFEMPREGMVNLDVLDVSGRLVQRLIENELVGAGRNERVWHGRDSDGRTVAAGVYFYRLESDGLVETRRMVLVK